jgi:hypothetical protein
MTLETLIPLKVRAGIAALIFAAVGVSIGYRANEAGDSSTSVRSRQHPRYAGGPQVGRGTAPNAWLLRLKAWIVIGVIRYVLEFRQLLLARMGAGGDVEPYPADRHYQISGQRQRTREHLRGQSYINQYPLSETSRARGRYVHNSDVIVPIRHSARFIRDRIAVLGEHLFADQPRRRKRGRWRQTLLDKASGRCNGDELLAGVSGAVGVRYFQRRTKPALGPIAHPVVVDVDQDNDLAVIEYCFVRREQPGYRRLAVFRLV